MNKYLDMMTEHLKEVVKCHTFSCKESEVERLFKERRKEFLTAFFRRFTDKCDSKYQYFEEHDDYVLLSLRFLDPRYPNGDDPSKFKLYPFHVEVAECISKKRATENLDKIENLWIEHMSNSPVADIYTQDKAEYDAQKTTNID